MVVAYADGKPIGAVSPELERALAEWYAVHPEVEFRDDAGRPLYRLAPPEPAAGRPICEWEPGLTKEEIDRRCRESPRMTLADFWASQGVK